MSKHTHRGQLKETTPAVSKSRTKTVYKPDEIPHRWAYAMDTHDVRGGNMSTLTGVKKHLWGLSYQTPIALRVETPAGLCFLLSHETYSNTSSRHITAFNRAIPADAFEANRVFNVPCLSGGKDGTPFQRFGSSYAKALDADAHTANLAHLLAVAEKVRSDMLNPRMGPRYNGTGTMWKLFRERAEAYRKIFTPRRKPIATPTDEEASALDAERNAIDARKRERNKAREEAHRKAIEAWGELGRSALDTAEVEALNRRIEAHVQSMPAKMAEMVKQWKDGDGRFIKEFSRWHLRREIEEPFCSELGKLEEQFRIKAGDAPDGPCDYKAGQFIGIVDTAKIAGDLAESFGTYLRLRPHQLIDGETIVETSAGATLELSHARTAWLLLRKYIMQAVEKKPVEFPEELKGRHIGPYMLNGIDAEALRIGCHVIACDEVADFARRMNWDFETA